MMRRRLGTVVLALALAGVAALAVASRSSAEPSVAKQTSTIRFSFSGRGHRAVPNGRELTRAFGTGTLTIDGAPQEGTQYSSTSATGVIKVHRWMVLGNRVIDEDNLTADVLSGQYRFTARNSGVQIQVKVTKSDSKETDPCDVGTAGQLGLADRKVKSRPDSVGTELCGVNVPFRADHAVVGVRIEQGTP